MPEHKQWSAIARLFREGQTIPAVTSAPFLARGLMDAAAKGVLTAEAAHPNDVIGLDRDTMQRKVKSLRVQMARRRTSDGTLSASYTTVGSYGVLERWTLVLSVQQIQPTEN